MAVTVNGTPVVNNYSSAVTTVTVTMPSGIAAGELLIVHLVIDDGSDLVITPPDGWTLQWRNNYQASSILQAVYTRVADGGEAGSYDWTLGVANIASAQSFRVGGQNTTFSDVAASANGGNSTAPLATGITTVTNDALAFVFFGVGSGTYTPSLPSGWTNVVSGNAGARGYRVATKAMPTAGAVGDAASTIGAARTWVASMWAVRPASSASTSAIVLPSTRRGGFGGLIVR